MNLIYMTLVPMPVQNLSVEQPCQRAYSAETYSLDDIKVYNTRTQNKDFSRSSIATGGYIQLFCLPQCLNCMQPKISITKHLISRKYVTKTTIVVSGLNCAQQGICQVEKNGIFLYQSCNHLIIVHLIIGCGVLCLLFNRAHLNAHGRP